MNITYETTAELNPDDLYSLVKEYIEKKTGKKINNIYFSESDTGTSAKVVFCKEIVTAAEMVQPIGLQYPLNVR
jgi:hypothetical protein